jgi:hypothetical protein
MVDKILNHYRCWQQERIIQVINKEAASVERSNFLATHAPLNTLHYGKKPQDIPDQSEIGLLQEFQRCDREDRHAFAVVQGIPGTGKSHLIRWLKELYAAENKRQGGNDVVLLIERAQGNLNSTLQQIIHSEAFRSSTMKKQLDQLHTATTRLSSETLSDTLLDQLRNATEEVELPDEQRPTVFIRKRVKFFLQDIYVRQELKKAGGPIDRIKRYLSTEKTSGLTDREVPGFEANDFLFAITIRRNIRDGGYEQTRQLVDRLQDSEDEETRQTLADYFNRLLSYAIGRTTTLTTEDLKAIFHELRRQLRKQNRKLALFIEDITAFTGIDEGLIDVLATQHTGEGNKEFCRLISVIGLTDNYFNQHFPDNMKERVTHRVTLNRWKQGDFEAELLQTPAAAADLAARYLNAMRTTQEDLDTWVDQEGARLEALPNFCEQCAFQASCHKAFGAVNINPGNSKPKWIGLYPFNEVALWTMFQQLQTTNTKRTPRSLLASVLEYVLESHGQKIADGTFPPPPKEVGSDFKPPSLRNIGHQRLLESQSGKNAPRIESLVLFWGSRTIDTTYDGEARLVGGLSQTVFAAFDLPFIEGTVIAQGASSAKRSQTNPEHIPTPQLDTAPKNAQSGLDVQQVYPPETTLQPASPAPTRFSVQERYTDDIYKWQNGEKLANYEKLEDWLIEFIKSAIPWDCYHITASQVFVRVRRAKMAIKDRAGRINPDCLIFERSSELASALQALDYLSSKPEELEPEKVGDALTSLSIWLNQHEEIITDFVRRVTKQSQATPSLATILLVDCLLLSCLQGHLEIKSYTAQELLLLILNDCARTTEKQWESALNEAANTHSDAWVSLMKGTNKRENYVYECRQYLIQTLNRPQGPGGNLKIPFIDAAMALDILETFEKNTWQLYSLDSTKSTTPTPWDGAIEIYNVLAQHFTNVLERDRQFTANKLNEIQALIGTHEPKAVFESIQRWIEQMKRFQQSYKLEYNKSIHNATRLSRAKQLFEAIVKEQRVPRLAFRLSEINATMKDAREQLRFLQSFKQEAEERLKQSSQAKATLEIETAQLPSPTMVAQAYDELAARLAEVVNSEKEIIL